MVCITAPHTCEKLVTRASDRKGSGTLHVVHCVHTGSRFMNSQFEPDAMEYLFTAARLVGGDLTMLRADHVDDALAAFAREHSVDIIVMGAPPPGGGESIVTRLQRRLPDVEFDIVH